MATITDTEDLGLRLDALRKDKGMTLQQLAVEAKIPFTTLQRRLNGDGLLVVAELTRISSALQVTPASWFANEVEA